jgi:hypothetical protein
MWDDISVKDLVEFEKNYENSKKTILSIHKDIENFSFGDIEKEIL